MFKTTAIDTLEQDKKCQACWYMILSTMSGSTTANDTLSLKILEAYTRDVGRGVARIDYDSKDSLSASTGDVVEIRGKRRTVCQMFTTLPFR
jgi:Cell division protein 48 (CDC48), N-terminal domain